MKAPIDTKELLKHVVWAVVVLIVFWQVKSEVVNHMNDIEHKAEVGNRADAEIIRLQYEFRRKQDSIIALQIKSAAHYESIKDSIRAWNSNDQRHAFVSGRYRR